MKKLQQKSKTNTVAAAQLPMEENIFKKPSFNNTHTVRLLWLFDPVLNPAARTEP